MRKTKGKYNLINFAVILTAAVLFVRNNVDLDRLFFGDVWKLALLILIVCLVHAIKAGRFYLELYGYGPDKFTYIKTYCKVIPISIIFPYKLGELFRMYCYGKELENMPKGIVLVLFDRFMDTIALVTVLLLLLIFNGGSMSGFVYVLLLFLLSVMLIYFLFPGLYRFWKMYMLRAKATERKLQVIKLLEAFNNIYQEITGVSRGRGMILYFFSLAAWGIEIGGMTLLSEMSHEMKSGYSAIEYLSSAMGLTQSAELRQFVFVSVVVMLVFYILLKLKEMLAKKKV